ncbi:MAG: class I SAM-dependent methyltransferase [Flexilinea sp.]|nr:class I SAM-dependent methyltransferase [Flexilinea sp.]
MDHFRTQYEKLYEGELYYWGTEPADFLDKLIALKPPCPEMKVLDIGCGEGKDAVYMAQRGYTVAAFDLTVSGIRKTVKLAEERGVRQIKAYVDDINDFESDEFYDIIYSTGTIQYLEKGNIAGFFEKVKRMTKPNGLNYFNVFVEKPFMELPPDWDREEKMWKSGELFSWYADWKIHLIDEVIFEDNSGGIPHFHCMDSILAEKIV